VPYKDTLSSVRFDMTRESTFSYHCNACKRCCHNKVIRVGPYEILRLARHLGISTTAFIARHTEAGGTVLRTRDDAACEFLNDQGCGVHPDRPLACRLYPLARWVDAAGGESFGHLTAHPRTQGVYGTDGTVRQYLDSQGVGFFFAMGERYGALYATMVGALEKLDPDEIGHRPDRRNEVDDVKAGEVASSWIDVDQTVAAYCRDVGRPPPGDLEATVALHIEAIEHWVATISRTATDP
jgi:Fe-S-cluster containining protein